MGFDDPVFRLFSMCRGATGIVLHWEPKASGEWEVGVGITSGLSVTDVVVGSDDVAENANRGLLVLRCGVWRYPSQ